MNIHSTAIVSKKAKLGKDVTIGPFSIIEDNVVLGDGVKIGEHCLVKGFTTIGRGSQVFTGAVIGSQPQDLKYKEEKSLLEIGENNIIREYSTFNPGTKEGGKTCIGNNNLFMAYAHVAHDCVIGNNCVLANVGTLAGHVTLEDHVVIGGLGAVHQFVRVGKHAIIGGCSKVVKDIPPFSTSDGHPARLYGLNLVGLRRQGISKESIVLLKRAYTILFNSGLSLRHALLKITQEIPANNEVAYLIEFAQNSRRGLSRSCRQVKQEEDKDL